MGDGGDKSRLDGGWRGQVQVEWGMAGASPGWMGGGGGKSRLDGGWRGQVQVGWRMAGASPG